MAKPVSKSSAATKAAKHMLGITKQDKKMQAYIDKVCELSHLGRDKPLRWSDESQMLALVQAMAYVENGLLIGVQGSMKNGYSMAVESLRLRG